MPIPDFDLFSIRSLNGSQDYAFEEFCAHLARRDDRVANSGGCFQRLEGAGGDGGVECHWTLPGGAEWGWQAKLFKRLDKGQLTESVEMALRIHPRLERYILCLPFDLTGPTGRRGRDQQAKWNEYVREWQGLAAASGRRVEFDLWSRTALLDRLLEIDSTGGRRRFWFDSVSLGRDWFERQIEDAAVAAYPRYYPKLRVDVPIGQTFGALGLTPVWLRARLKALRKLEEERERFGQRTAKRDGDRKGAATERMRAAVAPLRKAIEALRAFWGEHTGELTAMRDVVREAQDSLGEAEACLREELETEYGHGVADSDHFRQFQANYQQKFP